MTLARFHAQMLFPALIAALLAGCGSIASVTSDYQPDKHILIESVPSGAAIYLMGRKTGTTPMEIRERDIYPVSYSHDVEQYYGKVVLRRDGCAVYTRRLSRADVNRGLVASLDCGDTVTTTPARRPAGPGEATGLEQGQQTSPGIDASPVSLPEQRIRQLRLLQQLLDEGVLTAEEEKQLRRRLLNAM